MIFFPQKIQNNEPNNAQNGLKCRANIVDQAIC